MLRLLLPQSIHFPIVMYQRAYPSRSHATDVLYKTMWVVDVVFLLLCLAAAIASARSLVTHALQQSQGEEPSDSRRLLLADWMDWMQGVLQ